MGAATATVLVFDGIAEERGPLVERLRRLGYRGLRAKTPEEALKILSDARFSVGAAILPPDLPVVDLRAALADWGARGRDGRLGWIVAGARPDAEALRRLDEAGVELALWEPYADATLRFQVNRAIDDDFRVGERRNLRVPLARKARVFTRRGVKTATLYSLSAGGAFIELPHPSPRSAQLDLELVLPERDIEVAASVLYTNVPGNLRNHRLPLGMGVGFRDLDAATAGSIARCVDAAALTLQVRDPRSDRRRADRSWLRRFVGGSDRG